MSMIPYTGGGVPTYPFARVLGSAIGELGGAGVRSSLAGALGGPSSGGYGFGGYASLPRLGNVGSIYADLPYASAGGAPGLSALAPSGAGPLSLGAGGVGGAGGAGGGGAAAGGATAGAGEAGGGGYSLFSRLASAAPTVEGGGGFWSGLSVPKFLGGSTEMGLGTAVGRVLPLSAAGLAAKSGINMIAPGNSSADVLGNLAAGAGVGAGIGSLFGPGPGTAIGAGAGALIGGGGTVLANIFGEDKGKAKGDLRDTIGATAKAYGFNEDVYKQRFDLAVKAGAKDANGNPIPQEQIAQSMADSLINQHQAELQRKETMGWQQAQHQADLQAGLALQTQARDFFSPYTNNIVAAGASQADVLNHLADQVPGAYKGMFQAQAANALNNAQQMAGAYAAQTALMPAQMAMAQTSQANSAEIANQAKLFQYASQMMGRQGAGGGTDLVSQLQQAGGQYNAQQTG